MNYPCNGLILHLSHTQTGKTQAEDQACFAEFQVFMPSSARLQQTISNDFKYHPANNTLDRGKKQDDNLHILQMSYVKILGNM